MSEEGQIRKCTVIGNGRTLKDFDFTKIEDETIGMCLAYRHWAQIDWYPTYYACVDHVVLHSNHKDIKKMIDDDKCEGGYLLSRSILKDCPELITNKKVLFLEDFQRQRGNPFQYLIKWCSGSCAVLFALILGFNDIRILGIDCNYTEFIPDCENLEDGTLRITKTPENNPNYFMDDYQREGDIYNKPNCKEVHIPSWEHIIFILTGYTRLNNLLMNVTVYTTDDVEGLGNYFRKDKLENYFVEDITDKQKDESA